MTDWFALLGEPRRPWLDPDALKRKFLQLSAEAHPDRVHSGEAAEKQAGHDRYVELNAAYQGLRDPKERLRHLLQLEQGSRPREIDQILPEMMDLFLQVGGLCREADSFLAERERVTSPLLKVALFEPGQQWIEKLGALQRVIGTREGVLLNELKQLDADWPRSASNEPVSTTVLKRLEELYRSFSYFSRWTAQIQERIVRLSL